MPRHEAAAPEPPSRRRMAGLHVGQLVGWHGRPHRVRAFRSRDWVVVERCDPREGDLVVYLVRTQELVAGAVRGIEAH
jgi:hypothetical protein